MHLAQLAHLLWPGSAFDQLLDTLSVRTRIQESLFEFYLLNDLFYLASGKFGGIHRPYKILLRGSWACKRWAVPQLIGIMQGEINFPYIIHGSVLLDGWLGYIPPFEYNPVVECNARILNLGKPDTDHNVPVYFNSFFFTSFKSLSC